MAGYVRNPFHVHSQSGLDRTLHHNRAKSEYYDK